VGLVLLRSGHQHLCATDQMLELTWLGCQDETGELLHHDKYE
jgi:hypothetical protein